MTTILITGAGPTGLVLALALLQRNIPVRIIDEKEGPTIHSKAFGIHARSLELLAKLGVVSTFLEKGIKAHSIIFHRDHEEIAFELKKRDLNDTPYPFVLMLPQSETEQILIEKIVKLGGQVEWNTKLVGVENHSALLSTKENLNFDWLIGCDGGKSTVRHVMKLPFEGVELAETFLIVDIKGESKLNTSSPHFFFSKRGLVGLIALRPSLNRLIFPLKREETIKDDLQTIKYELDQRGCGDYLIPEEIKWFSYFKIHRRMVGKLRVGNCFLAGDAAHIHSPAGGQGMNTGIADAYNLAWKLSLVVKGIAQPSLLDSYEKERLPVARNVLSSTTRFTKLLNFVQKTGFFPLFFFVLFLIRKVFIREVARGLTQLSLAYKKSPYIQESLKDVFWGGPRSGERAPNVLLENGKQFFEYLNNPNPLLLLFQENNALKEKGFDVLVLNDAHLMNAYKANKDSVYFIRPDGVIGYRERIVNVTNIQKYLKRLFLIPS